MTVGRGGARDGCATPDGCENGGGVRRAWRAVALYIGGVIIGCVLLVALVVLAS